MSEKKLRSSRLRTVSVGTTWTKLYPAQPNRYAVIIGVPVTVGVFLSDSEGLPVATGILQSTVVPPLKLCVCEYPDLVRGALYASVSAGTEVIGIVETFEVS